MKVLVTGGTGFVGTEVVQRLHEARHSIRILTRKPESRSAQEIHSRFGAEVHNGDILQPQSLPAAVAEVDAIIHLVGIISEVGQATFENIHTRGTQNLLAAAKTAGLRRWVHMSALGTRPNAVARYHRSKWSAEEAVRQSGLQWTIFRPSLIYGPEDHFINLFAKMIRLSPVVPVVGNPQAQFQPVPVECVAKAFVEALTQPKSIGQTYDLCGPETFTMRQLIGQVLQVMNRKPLLVTVPPGLARFQAALLGFVFPKLLGKAPPLNRDQLLMLQEDNTGDAQPANELFDLHASPFREGIVRYLTNRCRRP